MRKARGLFSNLEEQSSKSLQPTLKPLKTSVAHAGWWKGRGSAGCGVGGGARAQSTRPGPASLWSAPRDHPEHESDFLNGQNMTNGPTRKKGGDLGAGHGQAASCPQATVSVSLQARAGAEWRGSQGPSPDVAPGRAAGVGCSPGSWVSRAPAGCRGDSRAGDTL